MRILHTADWHLCDRLGRIDRTEDLRRGVERVAEYCRGEEVDVLLVAGDLFSELARPDGLRDAIRHLQETFGSFLHGGGTILTLTGNHDHEGFCQTLRHAMDLAAPTPASRGEVVPAGRLYLATDPTLLRLGDRREGGAVQFVLMPYPTPTRYLDREAAQRYQGLDQKNRLLQAAFSATLRQIRGGPPFDPELPAVLSAHVHVRGAAFNSLYRISEEDDVVVGDDLFDGFAYVALGHIHRPQALGGQAHVRYSGSIERLDLGEREDAKSVVVLEIGPGGLRGEPRTLPLEASPIYPVYVHSPKAELPTLRERFPDAGRDLVHIEFTYTAGVDNLEETLRELEAVFPRWYYRDWKESGALNGSLVDGTAARAASFEDTVRDYLRQELQNHDDEEREAILARAEELMKEVEG